MAESQPEEEVEQKEPKCTCPYGCICSEKHHIIAILRSQRFKDKFGSLVDLALTENDDFTPDRSNEAVAKMESEAYIMVVYQQKIPLFPPVNEYDEQPMPKRHIDVYREMHMEDFSLKEFYSMSREELSKMDKKVWTEREKYVKDCEEKYLAALLGATHQGPERRRELYSIAVGVLLDYILEEREKMKVNQKCLNCPVHALRAMTPFFERLTEAGMDRILRLVELDKRHMEIQREVCTLCLCYINHPKCGMVLAEALGKILLNCTEEHFTLYAILMKEIFCYVCPIPGVHMYVDPDIFSTLIKYHCIALLLSSSKIANREIIDNLKIARAFDSIPIVERAYESNRVEVDTYYDPNFVIFMTEVGYPVLPGDARVKKTVDRQREFNKECLKLGMEKEMVDESDEHFMKRIAKEQKRWKKAAQEDKDLVERKKDMDLLADCLTRSVETWIWDHGEKEITSAFMTIPEKPYRFAEGDMPELAELVEKNNPKPIDPAMVKDLLERTKHRAPHVVASAQLAEALNLKSNSPKPEKDKPKKSTKPEKDLAKKSTKPEKDTAKKSSTKPETVKSKTQKTESDLVKEKSKSTVKQEPEKSKSKSPRQGSAGKTKAEKSTGKAASSKPTSDRDSSSSSPTQEETSGEQAPDQSKPFKVKQLQRCGFCNRQELPEAKFQKCARCRKTRYCSKECQYQHWRGGHKDVCEEKKSKKTEES